MLSPPAVARIAAIGVSLALVAGAAGRAQMFEPVKPASIIDALVQMTAQTIEDRARMAARAETEAARIAAARAGMTFHVLLEAIPAAGLVDLLDGVMMSDIRELEDGEDDSSVPYTLFAPTDQAFAAWPKGKLEKLLEAENKEELAAMIKAHVVPGLRLRSGANGKIFNLATLNGDVVRMSTMQIRARLTAKGWSSTITAEDITTGIADTEGRVRDSGVVHVVNGVLPYTYPSILAKDL